MAMSSPLLLAAYFTASLIHPGPIARDFGRFLEDGLGAAISYYSDDDTVRGESSHQM